MKRLYESNDEYIVDVLEEEEERLILKIWDRLNQEEQYLFSRYLAVRDKIEELKTA